MVGKKTFLSFIISACLLIGTTKMYALLGFIKFPLAAVQGAMAAGCLITASACVRACLETKLKLQPLTVDSPGLAAQQGIQAKLGFWATETMSNIGQTFARTAEFAVQKTATISAGVAIGTLGVYLAFCCLRTMAR